MRKIIVPVTVVTRADSFNGLLLHAELIEALVFNKRYWERTMGAGEHG